MNWRRLCVVLLMLSLPACAGLAPRRISGGPQATEDGILFRYYAPSATRVQLAGSWPENNWAQGDGSVGEANIGLMSDDDTDGMWELVVPLPPGRHRYIFWVDENRWQLDPGNTEEVPGGPMGNASLIIVFFRDGKYEIR